VTLEDLTRGSGALESRGRPKHKLQGGIYQGNQRELARIAAAIRNAQFVPQAGRPPQIEISKRRNKMSKHDEKQTTELSIEELDNVSGGAVDNFLWFLPEPAKSGSSATSPAPTASGTTTAATAAVPTTPGH
jgi:hypothetical protein